MIALLWKDFRINSALIIVGVLLVILGYVAAIVQQIYLISYSPSPSWLKEAVDTSVAISMAVSVLLLCCVGSQFIAGERNTRNLEFVFYLPPPRGKIVASKLVLAVLVGIALAGLNFALWFVPIYVSEPADLMAFDWEFPFCFAVAGFTMFGFGWLGSSLTGRPIIAFALSLLLIMLSYFGFVWFFRFFEFLFFGDFGPAQSIAIFYIPLGLIGIIAGSFWFTRRIEP